jgi:hypothetical protein
MYPSAAAARLAKRILAGRPAFIDADVSMRKVAVTSSSSTNSLTNSRSSRAYTFQSSWRRSSPSE